MTDTGDMTSRERRVRQRAEKIWNDLGRPEGDDEAIWHQAEAEIDSEDRSTSRGAA